MKEVKRLSLKSARKILGKKSHGISDEELEMDIQTATLLKDIFFEDLLKDKKYYSQTPPNVPQYGSIWKNEYSFMEGVFYWQAHSNY